MFANPKQGLGAILRPIKELVDGHQDSFSKPQAIIRLWVKWPQTSSHCVNPCGETCWAPWPARWISWTPGTRLPGEAQGMYANWKASNEQLYDSHLYNEGPRSALKVAEVPAEYPAEVQQVNGF